MAHQLAMAKIGTCNSSKYGDSRNKILGAKRHQELVLTSLELVIIIIIIETQWRSLRYLDVSIVMWSNLEMGYMDWKENK
jgi:hypothetical protein